RPRRILPAERRLAPLTPLHELILAMILCDGRPHKAAERSANCLRGGDVMAATIATAVPAPAAKPWYRVLYIQVLIAIVLGALFGWLAPAYAPNDWGKGLGRG